MAKRWTGFMLLALFAQGQVAVAAEDELQVYARASARLASLFEIAGQNRKLVPRVTSKEGAQLLSTLSDRRRFLDAKTYALKDLPVATEMCGSATKAAMSYLLFDMQSGLAGAGKDPAKIAAALNIVGDTNFVAFQDEISPLLAFSYQCMAKQIPLLEQFIAGLKPEELTDVRRAGLRQMQNGIFSAYYNFLGAFATPSVSDSNRGRIARVMAEVAPSYAAILPVKGREQIQALARSMQAKVPSKFAGDLAKIVTAMENKRCDGLCRI
ncbi:MAG: hypothetical protein V4857_22550 [Pseudomonadota bacterium]